MIPLRDASPRSGGRPAATWALIALNVVSFLVMRLGGEQAFLVSTLRYAAVPANIIGDQPVDWVLIEHVRRSPVGLQYELQPVPVPKDTKPQDLTQHVEGEIVIVEPALHPGLTLVTSMFMHGGWAHLLGNMIFLLVFGGRLEGRLGVLRYFVFYVLTGIAAALSHVVMDPGSTVPMVGASGAISGLLGGYALLWPGGRIVTLVPFWPFWTVTELPALAFVGIWVLMQVLLIRKITPGEGGVAVWAHLGGFLYGLLLIKLFDPGPKRRRAPAPEHPYVRKPETWFGDRDRDWP